MIFYFGLAQVDISARKRELATVRKWLGWFLYQLNNSYLKIGK